MVKYIIISFKYAFNGVFALFKSERNMRIHSIATLVVIILGFCLKISSGEWCLIVICIGFVFTAEAFNTAIEKIVNKISPEKNDAAGLIKDISAGAVLISAIAALIIGLIIFIPKILVSL